MSYYSELLSTAFDVLADSRAPQILALLPDTGGIQHEVNNNDSRFVFPEILLPQAARSLELSGGEFFIQDALQAILFDAGYPGDPVHRRQNIGHLDDHVCFLRRV